MKRWLIGASIAFLAFAAQALPTVADVQAEVGKGHYAQAETMMREVVAAKPGSARAHYVYAEILAHDARFADASREAAQAKLLDPTLKFAKPDAFRAFEQLLEREQARGAATSSTTSSSLDKLGPTIAAPVRSAPQPIQAAPEPSPRSGLPGWVWPVGLGVVAFLAWKMFSRPKAVPMPMSASSAGYSAPGYGPNTGYGPGYGPVGGAPSGMGGSGLMGAGLAAAGGVAAGMLAERLLERGREDRGGNGFFGGSGVGGGYVDPSPGQDEAARALEDRSVDFGNGGNDWDSGGSSDAGGGSDSGSSSDGGW